MDKEVIFKKRFLNKYLNLLSYLDREFGITAVGRVNKQLKRRINILKIFPESGQPTSWESVRSFKLHERTVVFYKIQNGRIVIVNMFDLKRNPSRNPYRNK